MDLLTKGKFCVKHVEIDKIDIEITHHLIIVVATMVKIREVD
jgi:hypothetical protein